MLPFLNSFRGLKPTARNIEPLKRFYRNAIASVPCSLLPTALKLPISPRLPFKFALQCHRKANLWSSEKELAWPKKGLELDESYILPQFNALDGKASPVDVRMAWDESGLGISFALTGKVHPLDCRVPMTDAGDFILLWLDMRDMRQVHRAGRGCHQFALYPTGGGRKLNDPAVVPIPIHLAKENPRNMESSYFFVRSQITPDGYLLECVFPADSLTDYRPEDYPTLGIAWKIQDKDLGEITLTVPEPAPFSSDPSFWETLELVE